MCMGLGGELWLLVLALGNRGLCDQISHTAGSRRLAEVDVVWIMEAVSPGTPLEAGPHPDHFSQQSTNLTLFCCSDHCGGFREHAVLCCAASITISLSPAHTPGLQAVCMDQLGMDEQVSWGECPDELVTGQISLHSRWHVCTPRLVKFSMSLARVRSGPTTRACRLKALLKTPRQQSGSCAVPSPLARIQGAANFVDVHARSSDSFSGRH